MADEIIPFPRPSDAAAMVVPDVAGFRVIVRNRNDLNAHEAHYTDVHKAIVHGMMIARTHDLYFIMTAAAIRKGAAQ
jgi:hypothetical protein